MSTPLWAIKGMNKTFSISKSIGSKTKSGFKKIKSGSLIPALGFGAGVAGGAGTIGAITYLMGYNKGKKNKNKKKG